MTLRCAPRRRRRERRASIRSCFLLSSKARRAKSRACTPPSRARPGAAAGPSGPRPASSPAARLRSRSAATAWAGALFWLETCMPERDSGPPEMTVKAVGLGLFLALVFGAANAYLGMKAGQTIAATIPAAVIAIALFRLPHFRGSVLEQNIARTAASVGEALVASAIFTIPAFMMIEIDGVHLWADLRQHYWQATMILLV